MYIGVAFYNMECSGCFYLSKCQAIKSHYYAWEIPHYVSFCLADMLMWSSESGLLLKIRKYNKEIQFYGGSNGNRINFEGHL